VCMRRNVYFTRKQFVYTVCVRFVGWLFFSASVIRRITSQFISVENEGKVNASWCFFIDFDLPRRYSLLLSPIILDVCWLCFRCSCKDQHAFITRSAFISESHVCLWSFKGIL